MAQAERVTDSDGPTSLWGKYPELTESKLFHEYLSRLTAGRDLKVMITAAAETGVGKTTLAFALALLWDQQGWTTEKATLDPGEHNALYDKVEPGSVLLLDEAEQAVDRRRAMSDAVRDVGIDFATKRYRQVFGIITAPSKGWLDERISVDSMDYWIQAQETDTGKPKGEAKVYRLREEEHYEREYTTKTEIISWPVLDDHPEFQRLEQMKIDRMEGQTKRRYVPREEVEELKANYWNKATKEARFHIVRSMYEHGLTQGKISTILQEADEIEGLSQQSISNYVNASSFEEVYSG
jgi:hypothetical protein